MSSVPFVDIAPFVNGSPSERKTVAQRVDEACRQNGFLMIGGHGVEDALIRKCEEQLTSFFSASLKTKIACIATPDSNRGYKTEGMTALARSRGDSSPPDLLERFTMGRCDIPDDDYHRDRQTRHFTPNRWPENRPEFRQSLTQYYSVMEQLTNHLMRLLAASMSLPDRFFVPYFDKHISNLTCNYYPAPSQAAADGQFRAGAHTDYGSLTILRPLKSPMGLQVQAPDGSWDDVGYVDGSFIINIGDLMARWTNDRWVSTMHRVVPAAAGEADRMSLAFFSQPNEDAVISCLPTCIGPNEAQRYEAVTSGEHHLMKSNRAWIRRNQSTSSY